MKIAVVSGASYGLGESISEKLIQIGYKVYGISRTAPKLNNQRFIWIQTDLTHSEQVAIIPQKITEDKIDVLVNNAGTCFLKKTLEYDDSDFEKMFSLNFKSPIKLSVTLFPQLKGGLILNISSISDRYPDPNYGLYGSSKTALNLFFETMAAENPQVQIVNLLPTYIDTPLQHKLSDNGDFDWGQCMSVNEVAESVASLIAHKTEVTSGARVIIIKNKPADNKYNPETLWVYTTSDKILRKIEN